MFSGCTHTAEMEKLQRLGHWPEAADAELRTHVAGCAECSAQLRLMASFAAARGRTLAVAPLAAPGLLWWRAQLRRRTEAMERLNRPMLGAQIFSLLLVLIAGVGISAAELGSSMAWLKTAPHSATSSLTLLWNHSLTSPWGVALAGLLLGTGLLLSGALALLATDRI